MPPLDPPEARQRRTTLERLWDDAETLIANSYLFRCLDADGQRELLARGRLVHFAPGQTILREGEPGESFFVIDQGVVEVTTQASAVPGEVPLTTLQRGAFFGEGAVLTGSPRTATVVALTDVATIAFDREDVDTILTGNPKARRLLDALVAGRARDAAEKIARASTQPPRGDPE